ncbi:MFS transporter [Umezawaea tangerina]|uniref:MFS transporter n=1 Tax=Umezawaea tangerina TaxID=84725 RepID=A0A2T0T1T5_9PSEU|nr:MFS transporter [Umezawaea tangerina]PRY39635.1 MFS transporter [Umezawaea tangerina]
MTPPVSLVDGADTAPVSRPRIGGPLRPLIWTLGLNGFAQALVLGASSVLLGLEAMRFGEAGKVDALALLTTSGAVVSMVVQPFAGALSDRTRSRFGRRVPWILGGSVLSGLCLLGVGGATGLGQLVVLWTLFHLAFNFVPGLLHAMIPDRVPQPLLGTFAAVYGAASLAGGILGAVFAALLADDVFLAWTSLAGVLVLAAVLLAVLDRDDSTLGDRPEPLTWKHFRSAYWVSPTRYPDFAWAFAGRFLMNLGYAMTTTYMLYILQDYVGLGESAVGVVPLVGLATLLGMTLTTVLSGPLSDRVGRRRVFVAAAGAIVAAATVVPLLSPTLPAIIVFVFCSGLGFGIYQAVDLAVVTEALPSRAESGAGMGLLNLAVAVPATIAPLAGSAVVHAFGTYAPIFLLTLVLSALSSLSVARIKGVR